MRFSLHIWLLVALALAIAVPAVTVAGAWVGAGAWQDGREKGREREAVSVLRSARFDTPVAQDAVIARLDRLGVDAQVSANPGAIGGDPDARKKAALSMKPFLTTPGLTGAAGKERIGSARQSFVELDSIVAALWIHPESEGTRWAIALGAGVVALAATLIAIVVCLRRWVLVPLAQLSADADRIAGGELDVRPTPTRAREVAQVGEAMAGMAGALEGALAASAAAERDRRFLVTAIAHDLRTPLFTLRGSLEALERGLGDGRYLGLAQDRAADLDRLIDDLFRFSRLELAPEFGDVDLGELVRRAAETVDGTVEIAGEPATVRGDSEALLRVLTNLLDNAVRHTGTHVAVTTARENGTVTVAVVDDGPGFVADDLPHVFEPLFRGDRARGGSHAGLGLAIARRIVRAHGGDVRAANEPGGGARLTVELPAA
jgi:signal transduction histidine kinase